MTAHTAPRLRVAEAVEAQILSTVAMRSKAHWPYGPEQVALWGEELCVSPAQINSSTCCVAEVNGEIAGFFLLESAAVAWVLEHFWVLPEFMGRGVGRALLAAARALAEAGGASAISIDSDPYAEPFYLACGAQRVGTLAAPIAGQPERIRPQLMLPINPPRPSGA